MSNSVSLFNGGTVNNSGKLILGDSNSGAFYTLWNTSIFNNYTGAEISTLRGVYNLSGTFSNSAKLTINTTGGIIQKGIVNNAVFENKAGGDILINNVVYQGISNEGGTFTNSAKLSIDGYFSSSQSGLTSINNQALFNNNGAGEISIKGSTSRGIYITSSGTFTNAAKVICNQVASYQNDALQIFGDFINNTCGQVIINKGKLSVLGGGTYTNGGLTNTVDEINNVGTFANGAGGVLKYYSFIGNGIQQVFGSTIINDTPQPIFSHYGVYDGTVDGIFKNELATISAGSFTYPNSFNPNSSLREGEQTLYVKITPTGGACYYIVPFIYNYVPPVVPKIKVRLGYYNIINGSTTTSTFIGTNFGDQFFPSGSISKVFTILNDGTAVLDLTGSPRVTITGSQDFSVSFQPNSPVNPSNTTTFRIVFDPSSLGLKSAVVNIDNNDADNNPFTFAIAGTGTEVCEAVSNAAGLITWTGQKNNDWNNTCNWSPNGVPTAANDVKIRHTVNSPIITDGSAVARSIELEYSTTFTIATTGHLTVNGYKRFAKNYFSQEVAIFNRLLS
jgi:hypothetical protein